MTKSTGIGNKTIGISRKCKISRALWIVKDIQCQMSSNWQTWQIKVNCIMTKITKKNLKKKQKFLSDALQNGK